MKGFKSIDSYRAVLYMLEYPQFNITALNDFYRWPTGGKMFDFVNWLVDLRLVTKTATTKRSKPRFKVNSRSELTYFCSRFRDMKKKITKSYGIAADRESAIKLIDQSGGILCLTTALELHGDQYFRDPTIHAYSGDPGVFAEMNDQVGGRTKVVFYDYDLPDNAVKKSGILTTSANRTILDLFCADNAYAAEQFIRKVWLP